MKQVICSLNRNENQTVLAQPHILLTGTEVPRNADWELSLEYPGVNPRMKTEADDHREQIKGRVREHTVVVKVRRESRQPWKQDNTVELRHGAEPSPKLLSLPAAMPKA